MSDAARSRSSPADRNLLFGILALQNNFIDEQTLIAAMRAWLVDKVKPLGQILLDHGALSQERRMLIEALVQEHLRAHQDDAHQSIMALTTPPSGGPAMGGSDGDQYQRFRHSRYAALCRQLLGLGDSELQESLAGIGGATITHTCLHSSSADADAPAGPRYQILREHAKGGLGQVFVAEDQELHREVAFKEIQLAYAQNEEFQHRFLLEAEITGNLEHPGVVPVFGLGRPMAGHSTPCASYKARRCETPSTIFIARMCPRAILVSGAWHCDNS